MLSATPDVPFAGGRRRRSMLAHRFALGLASLAALGVLTAASLGAQQDVTIPPPKSVERMDSLMSRPVGGLRPGDLLRVAVYKNADLSGEFLIDSRGFVQIPGMGVIRVAGLD